MPPVELAPRWKACLEFVLMTHGYMVGGSEDALKIYSRWDGPSTQLLDLTFYVEGIATYEDALRQHMECELIAGESLIPPPKSHFFYKLQPYGKTQ